MNGYSLVIKRNGDDGNDSIPQRENTSKACQTRKRKTGPPNRYTQRENQRKREKEVQEADRSPLTVRRCLTQRAICGQPS